MHFLQRVWKPLLALAAVILAFTVTFVYPERNGLEIDIDGSPRAQAARNKEPYDLTQLQVLNRTILEIKDHYVEPDRVNPHRMLLAGLDAIQRTVPPVLVHYQEGQPDLTVQVNEQKRSFKISGVDSPWSLSAAFRQIFGFLQKNLNDEDIDLRDVEYAAVNGMLRTLDPHTVLLTPDVFEEMQMSTRGEFGGLGIVISIRDGNLTVIRPMPNTPAARAHIQAGDRIVKINDESTLNMPLSEAVDRLRGKAGSSVTVWVQHKEGHGHFGPPTRHDIVRAIIHIDSVESRMLKKGIGYIKINNFQGNTYDDMHHALMELHKQGLKGLVLDLRDNPGGLLEQAVRVADAFIPNGVIVTTSSNDPAQQDKKFAHRDGTEPDYPMIVLVNGSSASASEIVAGALKNHDRALLVGQRTFGKGSVQVLYNFQDGSALKLTIAQYLTPGDVSIQGVGIVPDVAIDPMTVDKEDMDLAVDTEYLRESDLRSHLTHARTHIDKPAAVLRYYLPAETRQRLREAEPEDVKQNTEEDQFLTSFSQMILSKVDTSNRRDMIEEAKPVIQKMRAQEMGKAVAQLHKLGVDWSEGTDQGPSKVLVQASTDRPNNEATAGQPFELHIKVTNEGKEPLYRLRATTKSDFALFNDRELVFGVLKPGQSREWSSTLGICETQKNGKQQCRLPLDTPDRADAIRIHFTEAHGHAPPPTDVRTIVHALPRPQFAYSLQVADDVHGNGDGRVQRGEYVTMYLRVRNVGKGESHETQANLRNLSGAGILLHDGRFQLDHLAPGEEHLVKFTFEVLPNFDKDKAKLQVSVADMDLRESFTEDVVVPIADKGETPHPKSGRVTLAAGTDVRQAPAKDAPLVARAKSPLTLDLQAQLHGFYRVDMGDGRPGWVAESAVSTGGAVEHGALAFDLNHMPPDLTLDHDGKLVTRSPTLELRGKASDEQQVRDLYVFVDAHKVFYKSNVGSSDPRDLSFNEALPLHGGINHITVFARERDDVVTRKFFVVRRDAKDGSLLKTPPFDDDLFGMTDQDEL